MPGPGGHEIGGLPHLGIAQLGVAPSGSPERGCERCPSRPRRGGRRLHPAGDHHPARLDQGGTDDQRRQPAAALPVDRQPRHADAEPGLQRGVAGEVAAGTRAVAEHHLGHVVRGQSRVGEHGRQHGGGQVGGGRRGQPVAGRADGGPSGRDDRHLRIDAHPAAILSRSTFPAAVTGSSPSTDQRRGRWLAGSTRRATAGSVGGVGRIRADRHQHRPQPLMRSPDHDDLTSRVRSQRRLDVGQHHRRPAGRHRVGAAGDDEAAVGRHRSAIADGHPGPAVADLGPQHRGVTVLAQAEPG